MKIACNQPNYIPWYPFFHLIQSVDKFFILDVVKPGKKNYIVRNKIISNKENLWLTIPLEKEEKYKNICNSFIGQKFKKNHCKIIMLSYSKFFDDRSKSMIMSLYDCDSEILHRFNSNIIKILCKFLKIKTKIVMVSEYLKLNNINYENTESLIKQILIKEKCKKYLNFKSGIEKQIPPYNDFNFFKKNNIKLFKQNPLYCVKNKEFNQSIINLIIKKIKLPEEKIFYEQVV
tara:strand:+ start:77 stop:772 length:696 start_codon:yes stop_codon:yes gene_type:complete